MKCYISLVCIFVQKLLNCFCLGLFDQRLNKILDDPSDDTKGFLDPNTGENLTYLELIERCINDAETDLILLPLVKVDETHMYKDRFDIFL